MNSKRSGAVRLPLKEPVILKSEHDPFLYGNIAKRDVIETISRKAISPLAIQTVPNYSPFFHFSGYDDQYRNQNHLTHNTLTPPSTYLTDFHPSRGIPAKQKNPGFTRKLHRLLDRHTTHPVHKLPFNTSQRTVTFTKNYAILSNPSF